MKTVFLLIGKRGSGKTYIGRLIEKELGIRFLSVEPYFINAKEEYKSINTKSFDKEWKQIEGVINRFFNSNNKIIFESNGTFKSFKDFLSRLQKNYKVILIKVDTSDKLSLERTRKRDNTNHVPMTQELIKNINKIAEGEKYEFDIIIDNEKLSDEEIISKFKSVL